MLNSKEAMSLSAVVIILTLSLGIFKSINSFPYILLAVFFVILVNVLAKKISAFYLDSEIEMKIWGIKRYGFRPSSSFKKPFPAGGVFPLITSILSMGNLVWLASLVFDVKPKTYRAAKRHGLYSYSEMTEEHIGFIAASGVFFNLVFAIIGYLIGFSEFTKISIYFAFFNILPLSDLDGNKIFFGNITLWSFLTTLTLIGIGYVFFIV